MRVLITGGAGYIGSHLVDHCLAQGHEVAVLDDLSTGRIANLHGSLDDIRFVHGTILEADLVRHEVERADLVFHLAAAVGVRNIVDAPLEGLLTNTRGTDHVLSACARYWRKVLVASTSEVYGKTAKIPMAEDDDRVLGSTTVARWSYSTAKAVDEHLALAWADRGLPVSVVRYFNSYGPRIDPRGYGSVVATFLRQATSGEPLTVHGDGRQTRCFTYVDDTVRGTYLAATTPSAEGRVFNLGSDVETSVLELAERVQALLGTDADVRLVPYEQHYGRGFEDTPRRVPDITRAREVLGWEPETDLDDGLARTFEWWKKTHG